MPDKEKVDRLFNLKISNDLRQAIRKDAYEKDRTASSIVREILESYYGIKRKSNESK